METRIPKNRYNGGHNTESRKAQDTLTKIEAEMDKSAADIALTISDIFKFMVMSAAHLPNIELDTGTMRLKVNDNGIFFEISHPFRKKCGLCDDCDGYDDCAEEPDGDYDDDEEGLLYDGD